MTTASSEPIVERVRGALEDPRWEFRTAEGIASELGMPLAAISRTLDDNGQVARLSVMRSAAGQRLYTAQSRGPTLRERVERLRWLLAR